ncbi:disulfide reductase [candidate division WOR-3 bacterium 4484_100]|uniref:Disulfide reductase n=1 Tax=candidate division WOR-3 bacterium 4484_100 TaxID=1936077 RepID=A0A1V4QFP7_UNCW3|nr:MAG: disulfide reductase [candidate division WOR-3 bacterium 4484_100]
MKIGVYVCHCGGNISEVVDIKKVMEFAEQQGDVALVKDHAHMCSDVARKMLVDDIKEYGLDKVVIAACSPQFHGRTFMGTVEKAGLSPYVMEMANIREQCSWPHYYQPELATKKAKDIVKMAIVKARLDEPLEKKTSPIGKRVLVIGAGIAGIQAALDLGDAGFKVYLVEKEPSIGGKMAKLSRTFPTEDCAACILSPKMADVPANPNIELLTNTEIESISGFLGNYDVVAVRKPRYVDITKCTACDKCAEACPVVVPNEFDEGLSSRKAIYLPNPIAVPHAYVLDDKSCLGLFPLACSKCYDVCDAGAINYDEKPERINFTVDTIIVATGYEIFDPRKKKVYEFAKSKNVLTALDLERLISLEAEGTVLRPIGRRIAFIQCVGSRDELVGNEYCSRICCMYATKLSQLLKRADPKRDVYVFYVDLRAFGKGFEEYYKRAQRTGVKFIRGRVAELHEDSHTHKVRLKVEDTLTREIIESEFDLVILSVGLRPSEGTTKIADTLRLIKSPGGWLQEAHPKFRPVDTLADGVFICGCAQGPKDIPDTVAQASAAAARAIRLMNKGEYEVDPITAFVDEKLCSGCGICAGVCPYEAITIELKDGKRISRVNEVVCQGCGACVASCPSGAQQQRWFMTSQLHAMLSAALGEEV